MTPSEFEIREECARLVELLGCQQPWCEDCDSPTCPSFRLANSIRELNCRERGHDQPILSHTGRPVMRCRYCESEVSHVTAIPRDPFKDLEETTP